ncbi:mucin-5AC [Manduca sexta]|uniref:mucin-5AC n=1 Tax=Manduca sexta TaxID=7130 RepID=UPI001182AB52|nr:mucin-5AC [Manduca sexta]
MTRVGLWTAAALALATLATARIYERCELARDLMSFGAGHDDVATWVCIAFHESRLDTAANNPHSGDHGIFQISELYWCGNGKACGVPCSSFRDGDIRDDFRCALRIREEHNRFQGNGFLAWVVYPQYCKHNPKKYIADCNILPKNRAMTSNYMSYNTFLDDVLYHNDTVSNDNNPPSYLRVSAIFRAKHGKARDLDKPNIEWSNYKIDNIDELKLPAIGKEFQTAATAATKTTLATTTTYVPPVMPWRTIETNQFRRKLSTKAISSFPTTKALENYTEKTTTKPITPLKPNILTTVYQWPTTKAPFAGSSVTTTANLINVTSFVPTVGSISFKSFTTTSPATVSKFTTSKAATVITTPKSNKISKTTYRPLLPFTSKTTPANDKRSSTSYKYISSSVPTPLFSSTPSTQASNSFSYLYSAQKSTTFPNYFTTTPKTNEKSLFSPQILSSTLRPFTTKFIPKYTFATTKPSFSTKSPFQLKSSTALPKVDPTTGSPISKITTTQSIFNVYLSSTKQPKLSTYKFSNFNDGKYGLKIFSDGTTSSPTKEQQANQNGRQEER